MAAVMPENLVDGPPKRVRANKKTGRRTSGLSPSRCYLAAALLLDSLAAGRLSAAWLGEIIIDSSPKRISEPMGRRALLEIMEQFSSAIFLA